MVNLAESRKVSFHTPGHKSGKGIATRFRKFVGPRVFSIDLTTLDEVDSLQNPTGVIKEAQELAAKSAGADRSYFLVNGTTVGNHAMVASTTGPGDKVLIARNCHRSVLTGLIMSGAQPIFFQPSFDRDLKLTLNVTFDTVKTAIDANPGARALLITSPNYYGLCTDIEKIIPYAHEKGLMVFVDEAHGPHLKFHPKLPKCALEAGADMCVQSTHKIVGGMTQASMLHANAGRVNLDDVTNTLKLLQTTSPSYILMASLDLARMQMATEGKKLLTRTIKLAEEARAKINMIPGITCFTKDRAKQAGMADMDVTKLTITVSDMGLSGYHVSQMLNTRFGIQVEMADPFHVLVIVSIGDRQDDLDLLVEALTGDLGRDRAPGRAFAARQGPSAVAHQQVCHDPARRLLFGQRAGEREPFRGQGLDRDRDRLSPRHPAPGPGRRDLPGRPELPPEHGRPRRHHRRSEREQYVRTRGEDLNPA